MDTSNPAVIDSRIFPQGTPHRQANRRHRGPELKRQIVEETLAPGASVACVARAHGVNANQVFAWRRQYQPRAPAIWEKGDTRICWRFASPRQGCMPSDVRRCGRTPSGTIQVELPKGRLRLTGAVDTEALRLVLKELLA